MCAGISGQLFRFAVVSKGVDKVILLFFFYRGASQTMDSSVNQSAVKKASVNWVVFKLEYN